MENKQNLWKISPYEKQNLRSTCPSLYSYRCQRQKSVRVVLYIDELHCLSWHREFFHALLYIIMWLFKPSWDHLHCMSVIFILRVWFAKKQISKCWGVFVCNYGIILVIPFYMYMLILLVLLHLFTCLCRATRTSSYEIQNFIFFHKILIINVAVRVPYIKTSMIMKKYFSSGNLYGFQKHRIVG